MLFLIIPLFFKDMAIFDDMIDSIRDEAEVYEFDPIFSDFTCYFVHFSEFVSTLELKNKLGIEEDDELGFFIFHPDESVICTGRVPVELREWIQYNRQRHPV